MPGRTLPRVSQLILPQMSAVTLGLAITFMGAKATVTHDCFLASYLLASLNLRILF